MIISAIAAIAENNVIGRGNQLIWHLPADLKWFKSVTSGHHIIMGRKSHDSVGRALPGRTNIVVTRDKDLDAQGCIVVGSIEEGLDIARQSGESEAFIIGGGEIYRQSLNLLDKMYITWVHESFEGDVYFPEFNPDDWNEVKRTEHKADELNVHSFTICIYQKK